MVKYLVVTESQSGQTIALNVNEISSIRQKAEGLLRIKMANTDSIVIKGEINDLVSRIAIPKELVCYPANG